MKRRFLITLYLRSPLHTGSDAPMEVMDRPIARERSTGFPVIPARALHRAFLDAARELWPRSGPKGGPPESLFGRLADVPESEAGAESPAPSGSSRAQAVEAKLLAFPVRSMRGCFAWVTSPVLLRRFQRDSGLTFPVPDVPEDQVAAGRDLVITGDAGRQVVLEEYVLAPFAETSAILPAVDALRSAVADPLWKETLAGRLAIVNDTHLQHVVETCTEVLAVDEPGGTPDGTSPEGGRVNQEQVPAEAVFYTLLTADDAVAGKDRPDRLGEFQAACRILQLGDDERTGLGLAELTWKTLSGGATSG